MNGKGSSPRSCFSKQFKDNYDLINWSDDLIICAECGQPRNKLDKDKTMKQNESGEWICVRCNWN